MASLNCCQAAESLQLSTSPKPRGPLGSVWLILSRPRICLCFCECFWKPAPSSPSLPLPNPPPRLLFSSPDSHWQKKSSPTTLNHLQRVCLLGERKTQNQSCAAKKKKSIIRIRLIQSINIVQCVINNTQSHFMQELYRLSTLHPLDLSDWFCDYVYNTDYNADLQVFTSFLFFHPALIHLRRRLKHWCRESARNSKGNNNAALNTLRYDECSLTEKLICLGNEVKRKINGEGLFIYSHGLFGATLQSPSNPQGQGVCQTAQPGV